MQKILLPVVLLAGILPAVSQAARPFPQHTKYVEGSIKPNHVSQAELDAAVVKKWNAWKTQYLRVAGPNQYYVKFNSSGQTVSEAHGYGMLLAAIMNGSDSNARTYFDGMYRYYRAHPSIYNDRLMAYKQNSNFQNIDGGDSATDGDMDIGYALLLAHQQWGSAGAVNYRQAAKRCIDAILAGDVNQTKSTLRLGDWATSGKSKGYDYATSTRPSDFMLNHLKQYQIATGDARWKKVTDQTYFIINLIVTNNSPQTGLLPDFVVLGGRYQPAPGNFLEASTDGTYAYNACRTPWRIGTDYLLTGDTRALPMLRKLNGFIRTKTGGNASKIKAGYKLDGTATVSYEGLAFTIPFGVSAMTDSKNQQWLNDIWDIAVEEGNQDYYGDSLRLLSMIVISGNWWAP